jgi:cell division septation protein DedD
MDAHLVPDSVVSAASVDAATQIPILTPGNAAPPLGPPPATPNQLVAAAIGKPALAGYAVEHSPALDREPYIQLGSLVSADDAMFEWRRLNRRIADVLNGHEPTVTRAEVRGRAYWRLRTFGFPSIDDARDLCARLRDAGLQCLAGHGW